MQTPVKELLTFFRRPASEAQSQYRQALRYRDRRKKAFNFGQAIWHFQQAISLEPDNPVFHCQLGRAYAAAPLLAVTRGVHNGFKLSESADQAIAESKEALRLKPDYAEAYMVLGEGYMYLGEVEKALQAFGAVADLHPGARLEVLAEVESSQVEGGICDHPQPDTARQHLQWAVAYRDRGKYRRAERELDKALKIAPDWPWLYHNLCRLA